MLLGERLGLKGFAGAGIILASSLVSQVMGGTPRDEEEGSGLGEGKLPSDKSE